MMEDVFALQNPWRFDANHNFAIAERDILNELVSALASPKILGLVGSRQVGKSSLIYLLIQHLLATGVRSERIFYFNVDELLFHPLFADLSRLLEFLGPGHSKTYLFIDEVQRLEAPGLILKKLHDLKRNIKVCFSGSSQLEIRSKVKEHLVGRLRQFEVQRLSFEETLRFGAPTTRESALEKTLVYGSYPDVVLQRSDRERRLSIKDIYDTYVSKDLVEFLRVGDPQMFNRVVKLLAQQSGGLLNVADLSRISGSSRPTIEEYLGILQQTFLVRLVYPFHQNYRKEITKTPKVYFLDLGIRNFAVEDFRPLARRQDVGALFENFYFLQLLCEDVYSERKVNFWRTTNQTEIDFVVSEDGTRTAIETKWRRPSAEPRSFKSIRAHYPDIRTSLVSAEDFRSTSSREGSWRLW